MRSVRAVRLPMVFHLRSFDRARRLLKYGLLERSHSEQQHNKVFGGTILPKMTTVSNVNYKKNFLQENFTETILQMVLRKNYDSYRFSIF